MPATQHASCMAMVNGNVYTSLLNVTLYVKLNKRQYSGHTSHLRALGYVFENIVSSQSLRFQFAFYTFLTNLRFSCSDQKPTPQLIPTLCHAKMNWRQCVNACRLPRKRPTQLPRHRCHSVNLHCPSKYTFAAEYISLSGE